ncbi:MAG: hypothetical protein WDN30_14195 [Pararobbsia sp.]
MVGLIDDLPLDVLPAVLNATLAKLTGKDMPPVARVRRNNFETSVDRLVRYVRNAARYSTDRKFSAVLKTGKMPFAKALKLMAIDAERFRSVVKEAVERRPPGG